MSLAKEFEHKITEKDYLYGELVSDVKHEYIDGSVYAMVGASTRHNLITGNIFYELKNKFKQKKSSCNAFTSDMKVKISKKSTCYFYPDVMVVCSSEQKGEQENKQEKNASDDEYYQNNPLIIFEVLSDSTEKYDKSEKRLAYFEISSLKEYVLVEQNKCEVIVFERDKNWQSNYYFLGDKINFASIDVTLSIEDIYYHVNIEELERYQEEKELEQQLEQQQK